MTEPGQTQTVSLTCLRLSRFAYNILCKDAILRTKLKTPGMTIEAVRN